MTRALSREDMLHIIDRIAQRSDTLPFNMNLTDIAARLVAIEADRNSDQEAQHKEADVLLIAALRSLSELAPQTSSTVEAIIDAYEGIRKWYA